PVKSLTYNFLKINLMTLKDKYLLIKISVFLIVLFTIGIIGLILPIRPTESQIEKRELEKFPTFTIGTFWDGSYFSQISTWYADSFPFRENLLSLNSSFEELYGFQDEQIISSNSSSDETDSDVTDNDEVNNTEEDENYVDAAIDEMPETSGDIYILGDTGFSICYFDKSGGDEYVEMIDKAQKKLDGIADIYTMLVPTSIGINLSDSVQQELNSSDQKESMEYIYTGIENTNDKVKIIDIYDTLKKHNSEYIYFRTDHHWTALGAYYAYEEFCSVKGITPTALEDYETMEFSDFLGSLYSSSNQATSLKNNPDTITAYIPTSTNDMVYVDASGNEHQWKVIYDVSSYSSSAKYSTFVAGDQPFSYIVNPKKNDGSACVVIKESYGNALIPFFVDHYEYVYIVDYRYFYKYDKYDNSIYDLVVDKNITDVIFINNAEAMCVSNKINAMSEMFD
ncbi:MAG: hypothetical protein LUF02_01745, partial [Erysipelotrichaceae bacterium]|nr:hypothetical protein [Erysipelotrichaceae bacterium]